MRVSRQRWLEVARVAAWTAEGSRCCYCRTELTRGKVTADHDRPRARGGTDEPENIKGACSPCNRAKGAMPTKRFRRLLRGDGEVRFGVFLCRVAFRLNRRADLACRRILRAGGVAG